MKKFTIGLALGFVIAAGMAWAQGKTDRQEPYQYSVSGLVKAAAGEGRDGRFYALKIDEDGYVLATCKNKP
jgi:hypothetical protein